ncbi:MAG: Stress-induced protein [Patescibacteria group bacterium]|jgi:general stress protein YciG|nr:Stress-induced protein [Patescibacteria group bacterium]
MDEKKQREIASKGGHSQGKENNPGNFANDRDKARAAGRKGGPGIALTTYNAKPSALGGGFCCV